MILSQNLEVAAALTIVRKLGYTKGYSDYTLLQEFCAPANVLPYFPRPAMRLGGGDVERCWWLW